MIDKINYLKEKGIISNEQDMSLRRGVSGNRSFASIMLHMFVMIFEKLSKLEADSKIMQDRQSPFNEDIIEPAKENKNNKK